MRPVVLVPVLDGVDVVLDHGVAVVVVAIVLDRVHPLVLEAAVGRVEGGVRVRLGAVHDVGSRLSLGWLISERKANISMSMEYYVCYDEIREVCASI